MFFLIVFPDKAAPNGWLLSDCILSEFAHTVLVSSSVTGSGLPAFLYSFLAAMVDSMSSSRLASPGPIAAV